jgi:hypothetical protein
MRVRRLVTLLFAQFALLTIGSAAVVYQNTANHLGVWQFNGAAQTGDTLSDAVNINDLRLAPGSGGAAITSVSLISFNNGTNTVVARPTFYFWSADGIGGVPGTLLGKYVLPDTTFSHGVSTALGITDPNHSITLPANGRVWAGIGYDNDHGTLGITPGDLNALGALSFHPANVGTDGPQSYFIFGFNVPFDVNNPVISRYGVTGDPGNYGWTISAAVIPEPGIRQLGAIIFSCVLWRRRGVLRQTRLFRIRCTHP